MGKSRSELRHVEGEGEGPHFGAPRVWHRFLPQILPTFVFFATNEFK